MSNKIKLLLALAIPITVVGIGFLLISIFSSDEKEEVPEEENENVEVQEYEEKEPNNSAKKDEEENKNDDIPIDDEENVPHDATAESPEVENGEVEEDLLAPPLEDIYGKDEVKQAKKTAKKFLEAYYNFDGDYPDKSAKATKDYVTEDIYNILINEPEVPTHDNFKRELKSAENHESQYVPEDKDEDMPLIFIVKGEWTDIDGENKRTVKNNFVFRMKLVDDEYVVSDFGIDVPFY